MKDETDKSAEVGATPNRGLRREAPMIEGKAIETGPAAPVAPEPEPASAPAPELTPESAPEPAAARGKFAWQGPAAVAALLLGFGALYDALTPPAAPAPPPGATHESISALVQRVDALEARLVVQEARPTPVLPVPPDLAPISGRLDAVEKVAADARAQTSRALEQARLQPVPPPQARVDLGPLDQRLSRLEARLDSDIAPLRAALAAPKTEVRATQSPDVAGLALQDAATLAVIVGSLRQQLDLGASFTREASALEKFRVDPARLSKLTPLAAAGAPSTARLAQEFSRLAAAMLRAARPVRIEGDLMDRLARSAASLVRIRSVGESAGEDAPALVSRIEAALQRGDIAEALAAFDRLPDEVRAPARDWATRARQRVEALSAARSLLDDALDTLARK